MAPGRWWPLLSHALAFMMLDVETYRQLKNNNKTSKLLYWLTSSLSRLSEVQYYTGLFFGTHVGVIFGFWKIEWRRHHQLSRHIDFGLWLSMKTMFEEAEFYWQCFSIAFMDQSSLGVSNCSFIYLVCNPRLSLCRPTWWLKCIDYCTPLVLIKGEGEVEQHLYRILDHDTSVRHPIQDCCILSSSFQ